MDIQFIARYIINEFPDCCMAFNQRDYWWKDEYEDCLWDECMNFFAFEQLGICGCGNPDDTLNVIKEILNTINDCENKSYSEKEKRFNNLCGYEIKNNNNYNGLIQFVLYMLDQKGFLEHGGGIWSAWLTNLGKMFLEVLNHEKFEEDK